MGTYKVDSHPLVKLLDKLSTELSNSGLLALTNETQLYECLNNTNRVNHSSPIDLSTLQEFKLFERIVFKSIFKDITELMSSTNSSYLTDKLFMIV